MSLMEKGDIGCAVELLMLVHRLYGRQELGVTRGMCDVAHKALEREIDAYVEGQVKPFKMVK